MLMSPEETYNSEISGILDDLLGLGSNNSGYYVLGGIKYLTEITLKLTDMIHLTMHYGVAPGTHHICMYSCSNHNIIALLNSCFHTHNSHK